MAIQFRTHANGGVCCSSTNAGGERVAPKYPCDKCQHHFAAIGLRAMLKTQENIMESYDPPDPYALGIAAMRAAAATPESRFAEQYKAERTRELAAERASVPPTRQLPRLTAAELADYTPPDPYAAGIKALQLNDARRGGTR